MVSPPDISIDGTVLTLLQVRYRLWLAQEFVDARLLTIIANTLI